VERVRKRFGGGSFRVAADRGVIGAGALKRLEAKNIG
jgi:hypothetical protein